MGDTWSPDNSRSWFEIMFPRIAAQQQKNQLRSELLGGSNPFPNWMSIMFPKLTGMYQDARIMVNQIGQLQNQFQIPAQPAQQWNLPEPVVPETGNFIPPPNMEPVTTPATPGGGTDWTGLLTSVSNVLGIKPMPDWKFGMVKKIFGL